MNDGFGFVDESGDYLLEEFDAIVNLTRGAIAFSPKRIVVPELGDDPSNLITIAIATSFEQFSGRAECECSVGQILRLQKVAARALRGEKIASDHPYRERIELSDEMVIVIEQPDPVADRLQVTVKLAGSYGEDRRRPSQSVLLTVSSAEESYVLKNLNDSLCALLRWLGSMKDTKQ